MKLHGKEYEVEMIPCASGCGTMIESKDPHGRRPRRFVNHHAPKVIYKDNPRPSRVRNAGDTLIPCACGCGTMITPYGAGGKPRRYLYEHINRGRKMPEATRQKLIEAKTVKRDMTPIPCACGCSTMIAPFDTDGKPRKYVHGHFHRGRKRSEATRQKIIAARTIQRDMTPIPCACGCGTMIAPFDTDGRPRRYVNHHGQRKKKS
jgi:hypothetical protein